MRWYYYKLISYRIGSAHVTSVFKSATKHTHTYVHNSCIFFNWRSTHFRFVYSRFYLSCTLNKIRFAHALSDQASQLASYISWLWISVRLRHDKSCDLIVTVINFMRASRVLLLAAVCHDIIVYTYVCVDDHVTWFLIAHRFTYRFNCKFLILYGYETRSYCCNDAMCCPRSVNNERQRVLSCCGIGYSFFTH